MKHQAGTSQKNVNDSTNIEKFTATGCYPEGRRKVEMPTLILILQIVVLVAVVFLLVRKSPAPQQDPRLVQLADTLPTQLARLDARSEALDHHLRNELAQLRTDNAAEANRTRESAAAA